MMKPVVVPISPACLHVCMSLPRMCRRVRGIFWSARCSPPSTDHLSRRWVDYSLLTMHSHWSIIGGQTHSMVTTVPATQSTTGYCTVDLDPLHGNHGTSHTIHHWVVVLYCGSWIHCMVTAVPATIHHWVVVLYCGSWIHCLAMG